MNYLKLIFLSFILFVFDTNLQAVPETNAKTAIVVDFLSDRILYEKDADYKIYPASMTKIMTAIVAFDLIKKGETTLDEEITISEGAWRMSQSGYSSMFIMLNDKVTVEDLLKGIIIVSGNDACVALAEGLTGSEESFVMLMNEKAAEIGMKQTHFSNSSGINDPHNYSTVRDIALMSKYLIENYPKYYTYFKEKNFKWDRTGGEPITQGNRNPLLYKNIGADGIKTGYLAVERYSLASSIINKERRIISVASGFKTKKQRSKESAKLLLWGMNKFETVKIAKKNVSFSTVDVWHGKKERVEISVNEDIYVTVAKRKKSTIKVEIEYNGPVVAPIEMDKKLGLLKVYVSGELKETFDIFSNEKIDRLNVFSRLFKSFNFLIWGDV